MTLNELFSNWQLMIACILGVVIILYFARDAAHNAIRSACRVFHSGMRVMAKSVLNSEKIVSHRNKEVLLTAGQEACERMIEREFQRVNSVVERDLRGFPVLKRTLFDQVTRIDEDYQSSAELPPPPPGWVEAVEAIAKIPNAGDKSVSNILSEIHKTSLVQFKSTTEEYRNAVKEHHTILHKLMPYWRKMCQTLEEVGKTITGLQERSVQIDKRMDEYDEIRSATEKAERLLTSSSLTQFFISGFVLLIAIGGAIINFNLIALPMSEMVGGGSHIGNFKTSHVAALVIILVETAMGLYLMESLRITRLFPLIGHMDDRMRTRMIWITLTLLIILASIESSLAFMRDQIASNDQALQQLLSGEKIIQPPNSWIPTVGQMVMGFILPFVLTFVAIPLESFIHSVRTVVGVLTTAFLRLLAFVLRLTGNVTLHIGEFLVNVYDLLIFLPLKVEDTIKSKNHESGPVPSKAEKLAEKTDTSPELIQAEEV